MSWIDHHNISERLASHAQAALHESRREDAAALYSQAADAEDRALADLDDAETRTVGITVVSAASLHYKAGSFARAEEIAEQWLGCDSLPASAREELRGLLQSIRTQDVREQSDVLNIKG